MRHLDDIEQDALKEILNIGVGHAADSFSRMIGEPVKLSIPTLSLLYGDSAEAEIETLNAESGSMVRQSFKGGFAADGIFLFPGEGSLDLVRLMVGREMAISEMKELEQDALVEVGNILFNSCVSVISDMIGSPFECDLPRYESGRLGVLFSDFRQGTDCLMMMKIAFTVEKVLIQGFIIFMMKVESLDIFLRAIKKHLGLPS